MMVSSAPISCVDVVTCGGTPLQRGEQHGEALRDQIASGLVRWAEVIAETHGVAADAYFSELIKGTDFLSSIRRWTPSLLDEVDGIARGANQPWERIFASNLLDEEWTWSRARRRDPAPGCSVAGFAPDGGTPVLAQTMDINSFHDGAQAVIRIQNDDGPDVLMFTRAGMIGLTGCNEDGLAVVVNNLDVLPSLRMGLPVAFAIRGVLERRTLDGAMRFLSEVPHATGQHYGLAGPEGLGSVEAWATGIALNAQTGTRLLHTNHPLSAEPVADDAESRYERSRTRERLAFLEREAGEQRDAESIRELLCDCAVPISLDVARPSMTFGAVVYECTAPPRIQVTMGPPHQVPFHSIGW